jgi:tetratricopeptide (TPR) repeat protein
LARLSQLFRGELDWIVMKCLEKDRNRRYETASAFAADVQHYLHDEPVQACPPSAWYRFRKFARRNKVGLGIAALVLSFIALLGGGGGWVVRDRVEREAALDSEVNHALDEAGTQIEDSKWPEAAATLQRAEKLLLAAGRTDLPPQLRELQKDVRMALRLEEIYSQPKRHEFWTGQEQDTSYAQGFQEYGIDVTALPLAEAAERIRARSIRRELARALDFWSVMRQRADNRKPPAWKQLLEIAKAADPDVQRNHLRDALARDDRQALEALAASPDVARLEPGTLVLLAYGLRDVVGAPEKAMDFLRQAQRRYPGDLWLNDTLASLSLWSLRPPRYGDALRYYTAVLALRPDNPHMMRCVGVALQGKGAPEEAVATYSRAIDLKPDLWLAWQNRAEVYLAQGQREKALADFSKLIAQNPKSAVAWTNRGWVYIELHEYDNALADLNKAIELDANNATAWSYRFATHVELRQWDKAAAVLERAVQREPNGVEHHYRLALGRVGAGDLSGYRSTFGAMLKQFGQSDEPEVGFWTAWTCVLAPGAVDDWKVPLWLAEQANRRDPKNPLNYSLTFGAVLYRAGRIEEAIQQLEKDAKTFELAGAKNLKSSPAYTWFFLAMAHHRLGHVEEARRWLDKAIKWMDQEIQNPSNEHSRAWNRRLTLQLFRREAETLLGTTAPPLSQAELLPPPKEEN